MKLEKNASKSEGVLRGLESIANELAHEVDRVGRLENRISRSESQCKGLESMLDDKLQFYASEKTMQDQLAKFKIALQSLEQSLSGDNMGGIKQLSSIGKLAYIYLFTYDRECTTCNCEYLWLPWVYIRFLPFFCF